MRNNLFIVRGLVFWTNRFCGLDFVFDLLGKGGSP